MGAPILFACNLQEFFPAGDAEFLDWVETVTVEGEANLVDGHARLRIEVDDLEDTGFGRREHPLRGYKPNAAFDPVKFHECLGLFQNVADCFEC
jgi:hypothetical protein